MKLILTSACWVHIYRPFWRGGELRRELTYSATFPAGAAFTVRSRVRRSGPWASFRDRRNRTVCVPAASCEACRPSKAAVRRLLLREKQGPSVN